MFKRFAEAARGVVVRAHDSAKEMHHEQIGTEHLLLALASDGGGTPARVLRAAGVDAATIRAGIERLTERPPGPAEQFGAADAEALRSIGIDLDAIFERIEQTLGPEALRPPAPAPQRERSWWSRSGPTRFTPRARKVVELALRESMRLGDHAIDADHILLGLLRDRGGQGARVLTDIGVDLDELYAATLAARTRTA